MSLLLVTIALAGGEDRPLARQGEALQERLYARMLGTEGEGPVQPQYRRRRSGDFLVWEFEDGQVQRYQRLEGGEAVEERAFDASGHLLTTTTWSKTLPTSVVVHTAERLELDTSSWMARVVGDARVFAPGPGSPRPGGGLRWVLDGGRAEVWLAPAADLTSDAWRDGLTAGCGCTVLDRVTAWVDAVAGVRYRLAVPGAEPQVIDVWAVPREDATLLLSYAVDADGDPGGVMAPGRALAALVRLGVTEQEEEP